MKKRDGLLARFSPLLLIAVIVLALLLLVSMGTGLYSAVAAGQRHDADVRAALAYLAARVRAADAAGAVSVGAGPEGDALLLREEADGEIYETRIYLCDGALYEEYSAAGLPLRPDSAERIVALREFSLREERAGLLIAATEYGETRITLRCAEEAMPDA